MDGRAPESGAGEGAPRMPYLYGASVAGPYHRQTQASCEDEALYHALPGDLALICVADGAGSAARARDGARIATRAAMNHLLENRPHAPSAVPDALVSLARAAIVAARHALEEHAAGEDAPLEALACTLMVVVLAQGRACVAQVGDGNVVALCRNHLQLVCLPGHREYINETDLVTHGPVAERIRTAVVPDGVTAVAVMTDGCERAGLRRTPDGLEPHPGFFLPIFQYLDTDDAEVDGAEQLVEMLESPRMAQSSEDDKTLVIAVRRPAPAGEVR